jgi:hypothetical protein
VPVRIVLEAVLKNERPLSGAFTRWSGFVSDPKGFHGQHGQRTTSLMQMRRSRPDAPAQSLDVAVVVKNPVATHVLSDVVGALLAACEPDSRVAEVPKLVAKNGDEIFVRKSQRPAEDNDLACGTIRVRDVPDSAFVPGHRARSVNDRERRFRSLRADVGEGGAFVEEQPG